MRFEFSKVKLVRKWPEWTEGTTDFLQVYNKRFELSRVQVIQGTFTVQASSYRGYELEGANCNIFSIQRSYKWNPLHLTSNLFKFF